MVGPNAYGNWQMPPQKVGRFPSNYTDSNGVIDVALLQDVVFTLPQASRFPGKQYTIQWYLSVGGAATVARASGDTIGGIAGNHTMVAVLVPLVLISDGISDWLIITNDSVPAAALPPATATTLGAGLLAGTPASAATPTFPALQTGGKISPNTLPSATSAAVGGVKTDGNEASAPATVPALHLGVVSQGVLPDATSGAKGGVMILGNVDSPPQAAGIDVDTALLDVTLIPPAKATTLGGVEIVGTPISALLPKVPVQQADTFIDDAYVDPAYLNTRADARIALAFPTAQQTMLTGIRSGTKAISGGATSATVTFTTPVASASYAVALTQDAAIVATAADVTTKTVNGFTIAISVALDVTYNWLVIPFYNP